MGDNLVPDLIGYAALVINLISMSRKSERQLRIISTIANTIYIIYGFFLWAMPIVIGGSIAVGLHLYRLRHLKPSA